MRVEHSDGAHACAAAIRALLAAADRGAAGAEPLRRLKPGRVRFQGHVLATGDFLATWATELAVHHLDLDLPPEMPAPDDDALRLARQTAEVLAGGPIAAASDAEATLRGWRRLG